MLLTNDYYDKLNQFIESKTIYAADNIYNDYGLLLIKKGFELNKPVIERIKQSKLNKSLDHIITLDETLSKEDIFYVVKSFADKYPFIGEMFMEKKQHLNSLIDCLKSYEKLIIVKQKLTMLKDINPYYFEKAIFSAMFSIMMYHKNPNKFKSDLKPIFFAALSNNLGCLHIANDQLIKNEHSINIISYTFLKDVEHFPEEAPYFILQSLENCYGTGKPKRLSPENIRLESQLIHIANDYYDYLICNQHNHFFQRVMVSYRYYSETVSNAFIDLFKVKTHHSDHPLTEITNELISEIPQVKELFIELKNNHKDLVKSMPYSMKQQFLRIFENMLVFERSSGIIHESFSRWIQYVHDNNLESASEEMHSTYYMLKNFKEYILLLIHFDSEFTMEKTKELEEEVYDLA